MLLLKLILDDLRIESKSEEILVRIILLAKPRRMELL